jgi:LmbE family N-acetylglucosaminyl deacetylase
MAELSLLGVFAHPDDEQTMSGAYAKAVAEGIKTGLICATRGELGEIAHPHLATPETLGTVREAEMRAAADVLNINQLYFLDYRDSGMMGTAGNEDPDSFYRVNDDEALARIVKIIREFRPTIMVTFDATGGYGHPDHLTIHRLTNLAYDAAADPALYPEAGEPWQTSRLFYSSFPRSQINRMADWLEEQGIPNPFADLDPEMFGMPDELVTHKLDVAEYVELKNTSLNKHATQMNPDSPFTKMPPEFLTELRSNEFYALAAGTPLPETPDAHSDLFAGLRD